MSLLSGDSRFNMEAFTLEKKVSKVCLKGWQFVKRWPTEKGLEMLDIPWINVDGFKAQGNCSARVEALCKTQSSTMARPQRCALH